MSVLQYVALEDTSLLQIELIKLSKQDASADERMGIMRRPLFNVICFCRSVRLVIVGLSLLCKDGEL